jgi:hypothetical protein
VSPKTVGAVRRPLRDAAVHPSERRRRDDDDVEAGAKIDFEVRRFRRGTAGGGKAVCDGGRFEKKFPTG